MLMQILYSSYSRMHTMVYMDGNTSATDYIYLEYAKLYKLRSIYIYK